VEIADLYERAGQKALGRKERSRDSYFGVARKRGVSKTVRLETIE
jgi:hypothetical protein